MQIWLETYIKIQIGWTGDFPRAESISHDAMGAEQYAIATSSWIFIPNVENVTSSTYFETAFGSV